MSKGNIRRRIAIAVTVVIAMAAPLVSAGPAFGDEIADKRSEAARVADQVDALGQQAEVIAEHYNDARLQLSTVEVQAKAAKARADKSQRSLADRRAEMSGYAVAAYVRGGDESAATLILTSTNGNDLGQRQGYASVAAGQNADAVDQVRAAISSAEADQSGLAVAKTALSKVETEVAAKRTEAQAAVRAANAVLDKVNGELRSLVVAEQARRAAAAAAAAQVAARRFAAEQAAYAAAHPAAPAPSPAATGSTRPATTTATAAASNDSNGGGGGGASADAPSSAPVADIAPVGVGADAAIAAARSVLGVRYTWGGASPSGGFDCSGLVMWAWQHGGKSLPHSSRAMYGSSRRIPIEAMQPGDLVFYGSPVHHVALYIGGGQIIHSPHTGSVVQVASVSYWSDIVGAGRV